MNKLKFIILLLFCVQISDTLYSQKIFREGYIIKNNGELLSGLVGFSPGNKPPSVCYFKRFDVAFEIKYKPEQILEFGYINGKRFESVAIGVKKTFIETLVKGEITVYFNGSKFYLKKGDLSLVEVSDGKNSWPEEKAPKQFGSLADLLKYITSESNVEIRDNMVLKNDLVAVIEAYNKESGKSFKVYNRNFSEKELTLSAWRSGANLNRFSVLAGINYYILGINPSEVNIFLPVSDKGIGPMFGFSYERVLSKKSDKLTFRADLLYLNQEFYTYSEREMNYGNFSRDDAFYNFSAAVVPLLLQYSFVGSRITPYFNGGICGKYFFNNQYRHISEVENKTYNTIRTYEDNDMVFNVGELSATVGMGLKIRVISKSILSVEGRVEFGTGTFNKSIPAEKLFGQYSLQPSILIGFSF